MATNQDLLGRYQFRAFEAQELEHSSHGQRDRIEALREFLEEWRSSKFGSSFGTYSRM